MTTIIESPVGPLLAEVDDTGVRRLEFHGGAAAPCPVRHPVLDQLRSELASYFAGELKTFTVPLSVAGTTFQQKVWTQLTRIPYGETCSYKDVADEIGHAAAVRAVGSANGRNRLCIVIPCHRVIAHDGSLGGYGGGLERKRFLLDLEQSV